MVSYYGQSAMYRHQQQITPASNGHFQSGSPMHSWYGYHQQTSPATYCVHDEQQMWHHHPAATHPAHPVFQHEFTDFIHNSIPALQHPSPMGGAQAPPPDCVAAPMDGCPPGAQQQLPSPPVTVSGSEMSSPGGHSAGTVTPPHHMHHHQMGGGAAHQSRPAPARSPFEWIKKTSYQTQPNPGKTRTKDKYRVVYTDHQRIELEKEFTFNNKYITIRRKSELATNLGLSERQIKIWFQNRRAKERKQNKKRAEEKNQIDIVSSGTNGVMNGVNGYHHQMEHQMPQQGVLPNMSNVAAIQRYMDSAATNHPLKIESVDTGEQLG
nr:unnamed protein product [Callosobruchus chinensis]